MESGNIKGRSKGVNLRDDWVIKRELDFGNIQAYKVMIGSTEVKVNDDGSLTLVEGLIHTKNFIIKVVKTQGLPLNGGIEVGESLTITNK